MNYFVHHSLELFKWWVGKLNSIARIICTANIKSQMNISILSTVWPVDEFSEEAFFCGSVSAVWATSVQIYTVLVSGPRSLTALGFHHRSAKVSVSVYILLSGPQVALSKCSGLLALEVSVRTGESKRKIILFL